MSENRIYVVLPEIVLGGEGLRIVQPAGRQIAQACHVVSKLRKYTDMDRQGRFVPITTIILQARDTQEMCHVSDLLAPHGVIQFVFHDVNPEAYKTFDPVATALAALMPQEETERILDYLPLWGAQ